MKSLLIISLFYILNFQGAFCQINEGKDIYYVHAINGLNLRESPNQNSKVFVKINYSDTVIKINEKPKLDTINKIEGHWVKVVYNEISGFIFDAYISKLPTVDRIKQTSNCLLENLDDYLINQIGVIDSFKYSNYSYGESHHEMKGLSVGFGIEYIKHSYWESYQTELQFTNFRKIEVLNLLNGIHVKCYLKDSKSFYNLIDQRYGEYELGQNCCNVSISSFDNKVIVKFGWGP